MKNKKLITLLMGVAMAGCAICAVTASACGKKSGGGSTETGNTYYVSPTGTAEGAGTKEDPIDLCTLMNTKGDNTNMLKAGDTVLVEPGDYDMSTRIVSPETVSGEYNKPITIKCSDPTQKATLKFYSLTFDSVNRGVQIYGNYFVWDGIDICGAGDNGMYIGGSYNIVQNCEFYDNRDTGLQLGRSYSTYEDIAQWPSYNLIKNCTSYNNYDNETYGENADGFAAKLTVGYGNVFDGCIAYRNSDDGWDLYAKTDSGNIGQVIMYNCVAFENGYLMESQESFNAKFPNFRTQYVEAYPHYYSTRDGDGNGFKLGGSIMNGEVLLHNCLAFNNRMHGVTDNSNPGVITIDGVTSYNNAAAVDNDKTSATYGYIKYGSATGADECANIDLARQTYSYNHVANTLSVNNGNSNLNGDAYRGTVENSKFWSGGKSYTVSGQDEYNTKTGDRGTEGDALVATDVFKALPANNYGISYGTGYTTAYHYVDETCRNEDGSINMGDLLALKDETCTYGSVLNKTSWEDYTHYDFSDLTKSASADDAAATAVCDMVYLPIRTEACYQNFKAVTKMLNATISWSSSDESLIRVTDKEGTSYSKHKDITIEVLRPTTEDKKATLTATITVGDVTKEKSFEINIKKNTYRIGEFILDGVEDGVIIVDKGETALSVKPPVPQVVNGTSDSGAIIDSNLYTRIRTVKYAPFDDPTAFESKGSFDATLAGIWQVTEVITINSDVTLAKSEDGTGTASNVGEETYYIYIAARDAQVEFASTPEIIVNRDGFSVAGDVTSPTGVLYTLTLASGSAAPTAADVVANGVRNEFRATSVKFNIAQDNSAAYDIYYVMQSLDGSYTSAATKQSIGVVNIGTKAEFESMLAQNNSSTIYLMTADIDCEGTLNTSATPFVGLFNGMGHKLYNVTLTNTTDTKHDNIPGEGIFKQVNGGTIMNVTFENITINDAGPKTGIIALMYGGYVSNVKVHNISLTSTQRAGGLIGQIIAKGDNTNTTYVNKIEVINDEEYVEATVTSATFEKGKYFTLADGVYTLAETFDASATYYTYKYVIKGDRSSAIIGFIQAGNANGWNIVYVSDCYAQARIESGDYCGGIIGRSDDRNAKDELYIKDCYFNGNISCLKRAGGILGGFTGSGKTRITDCLSLGTFYYADPRAEVEVAQKNCSGIVGNYAGNADMEVSKCYSLFAEYNTNYEVETVLVSFASRKKNNFFSGGTWMQFDTENTWEYIDNETDDTKLAAPYIRLK